MADDLLAVARDRARSNRFWQHLGIDVVDVREAWAKLRVKVSDELRNAPGAPVHGGVYAALVDAAIGCARQKYRAFEIRLQRVDDVLQ